MQQDTRRLSFRHCTPKSLLLRVHRGPALTAFSDFVAHKACTLHGCLAPRTSSNASPSAFDVDSTSAVPLSKRRAKPAWGLIHATVQQSIRERQLLPRGSRMLIAVSGGQDSLCCARLLLDLGAAWGWHLAVAHCDHRWRADSAPNAEHVRALAGAWGVPFHLAVAGQEGVGQEGAGQERAGQEGAGGQEAAAVVVGSEDSARVWRYACLAKMAEEHGCSVVVTGHTASDRAETLLLNLMRGSGADGLQALAWHRPLAPGVELVRPMLELSRLQTAAFCAQFHLPVWEDCTNADVRYKRNAVRLELLPLMRARFNPRVDRALSRAAETLTADVAFLEGEAAQLLQRALVPAVHHPSQAFSSPSDPTSPEQAVPGPAADRQDGAAEEATTPRVLWVAAAVSKERDPPVPASSRESGRGRGCESSSRGSLAGATHNVGGAGSSGTAGSLGDAGRSAQDQALVVVKAGSDVGAAELADLMHRTSVSRLDGTGQASPAQPGRHSGSSRVPDVDWDALSRLVLRAAPLALRRRAVRQLLLQRHCSEATGMEFVERVLALLEAPQRSKAGTMPGGCTPVVAGDWILFSYDRLAAVIVKG